MRRSQARLGPSLAVLAALTCAASFAHAAPDARHARTELLRRMDRYFQRNEVDGVVLDARWVLNETEAVRLSVMPQLLGYAELQRQHPKARFRQDIQERADYLVDRLDLVRSGGVFDGMLAYSLLEAYEFTGDPRHLAGARSILEELRGLRSEWILNGGLMAAMAFAREYRRTGDPSYQQDVGDILTDLEPYQHTDGSFPHWCPCSTDVHYTDWMAQELILIARLVDDPRIAPMLERMHSFLEARVGDDGVTRYEAPCPWDPTGCIQRYWSVATGCSIDYDTRGFTNELGYTALVFDHFDSPKLPAVLGFLDGLEDKGVIADKWDYPIPEDDPYWPWTSADTSVVNMSLIFWSLAAIPPGRGAADDLDGLPEEAAPSDMPLARHGDVPGRFVRRQATLVDRWSRMEGVAAAHYCDDAPRAVAAAAPPPMRIDAVTASPARGPITIRCTVPSGGSATLRVHDVGGRLVRAFVIDAPASGVQEVHWDGMDEWGRRCGHGIYFLQLRAGGARASARMILGTPTSSSRVNRFPANP